MEEEGVSEEERRMEEDLAVVACSVVAVAALVDAGADVVDVVVIGMSAASSRAKWKGASRAS